MSDLLIGLANKRSMSCALFTDLLNDSLNRVIVLLIVKFEAYASALLDYSRPQRYTLLSNTTSEHKGIHPPFKLNVVASNELDDPVDENITGQLALRRV